MTARVSSPPDDRAGFTARRQDSVRVLPPAGRREIVDGRALPARGPPPAQRLR
jgi:hypothetical protein